MTTCDRRHRNSSSSYHVAVVAAVDVVDDSFPMPMLHGYDRLLQWDHGDDAMTDVTVVGAVAGAVVEAGAVGNVTANDSLLLLQEYVEDEHVEVEDDDIADADTVADAGDDEGAPATCSVLLLLLRSLLLMLAFFSRSFFASPKSPLPCFCWPNFTWKIVFPSYL